MIAVIPVRDGTLPVGALETAGLAGRAVVAGEKAEEAATLLTSEARTSLSCDAIELGPFAPARYAERLSAPLSGEPAVVLPACPDGRDLAPRLAARLARPLFANAVSLDGGRAVVLRHGGRQLVELECESAYVATLHSGSTTARSHAGAPRRYGEKGEVDGRDPRVLELLPPDPETVDLAEAPRILGIGAGAASPAGTEAAAEAARLLGASLGGTRVVTDAGTLDHRRQIGTTGVSVSPGLYLAFGISGAAQHVAGLGEPSRIVSVNTDPSCPMSAMADLAIVSDAAATLAALAARLREREASSG